MAKPSDLIPGNCYFRIHFYDGDLLIPQIDPYIFRGTQSGPNGEVYWLFDDPDITHRQTTEGNEGTDEKNAVLLAVSEDQLYSMLELSEMRQQLAELEGIHPLVSRSPDTGYGVESTKRTDFPEISGAVEKFYKSATVESLHLQIRYTDDGLFLRRQSGRVMILGFLHSLVAPHQENAFRSVCESYSLEKNEDYLSNRGRVRILSYWLQSEMQATPILVEALGSMYEIAAKDELIFDYRDKDSYEKRKPQVNPVTEVA